MLCIEGEGFKFVMDSSVERVGVGEGLVGEVMRLEIAPDGFDVVRFRRILGQPLDGQPVSAGGQCGSRGFAGGIGPLSSTSTTGLVGCPGFGS